MFSFESKNITIQQISKHSIEITIDDHTITIPINTFKRLVREFNLYSIHNPEKINFN